MYALLTFPTPAEIIGTTSTGATLWAQSFLVEMWPLIYIGVGLFVMAMVINYVIRHLKSGISHAFVSREERESKDDWAWSRSMYNQSKK